MNARLIHTFFNQAKIWQLILCWFTYFVQTWNWSVSSANQIKNNFMLVICTKHKNQERICLQILALSKKLWICLKPRISCAIILLISFWQIVYVMEERVEYTIEKKISYFFWLDFIDKRYLFKWGSRKTSNFKKRHGSYQSFF